MGTPGISRAGSACRSPSTSVPKGRGQSRRVPSSSGSGSARPQRFPCKRFGTTRTGSWPRSPPRIVAPMPSESVPDCRSPSIGGCRHARLSSRAVARDECVRNHDDDWPFLAHEPAHVASTTTRGARTSPPMRQRHGANPAFVNPRDLAALGIDDGDVAMIESQHGDDSCGHQCRSRRRASRRCRWRIAGVRTRDRRRAVFGSQVNALVTMSIRPATKLGWLARVPSPCGSGRRFAGMIPS